MDVPLAPETLPAAGLLRRLAALSYDTLIVAGMLFFLTLVLVLARGGEAIPPGSWWYGLILLGGSFGFFGWSWTRGGQTLGARAWGLRVVRVDGRPFAWRDAAARYAAAWLLLLPPGLGFVWAAWDNDRLCWHDRLSGTRLTHPGRTG